MTRTALVTGAGRGIGRAIAETFHARGWRVGVFDVDGDAAEALASSHEHMLAGTMDVRDEDAWTSALERLCGPSGGLDLLVNNAGLLRSGPFATMPVADHRVQVDVNVSGTLLGARLAHHRLARSRGMLLNLCSASAIYGQPMLATYGATKAAVKSLTEALDLEWRGDGVRVRSLLPLFVDTDMVSGDATGAASVQRLGVRLTTDDVARAAWRTWSERGVPLRGPHRVVGRQTLALRSAASVAPDWVVRQAIRLTSG
ncbi:SDR family oxidoreductase [Solicola sp. PLA-1-18]|uniref:SDR family oxidoreductase n=1 Tax=Solicola sp. PLA-1-18 TaxID=3380532 RepID=UPI003B7AAE10